MTDNFQRDYNELKDLEKNVSNDLKKRKDSTSNSENTVRLEQQIFKGLDTFGKRVDMAMNGYKNKYKDTSLISQDEANRRINMLNELAQSHQTMKKGYDQLINDKYQYVSI